MAKEKLRILIVDDSRAMAQTIWRNIRMKLIGKIALTFEIVESGEDAIKILESDDFDVIVSDVQMNGMSGFDFLRYMKKKDANFTSNVLFILMSAGYTSVYFSKAQHMDAKFCPKDKLHNLIEMIQQLILSKHK